VHELSCRHFAVTIVLVLGDFVGEDEMTLDVLSTSIADCEANDPHDERVEGERGHEHHPEVDEEEDLLVEEVDWKHTLDVVAVNCAQSTHLQVAHCDSWKSRGGLWDGPKRRPIMADIDNAEDDVDTVRVEWNSKEHVEQEELSEDVDEVHAFDDEVSDDEIIAAMSTTQTTDSA